MAITISGENNNDKILAQDGVIDQISGINIVGLITASHINVGNNIQLGNAGIITATTFVGNLTGNVNSTSPLLLQTGGSERFRITGNNELGIAGANYGSSGQVLTSGGSVSAVTWSAIPTQVTISNNADNRVITGGSGTNLNGESNLTFNGTAFQSSVGGIFGNLSVGETAHSNTIQQRAGGPLHLQYNQSGDVRVNEGGGDLQTRDIKPESDSSYNIGTNSVRYANIYADTLYGNGSNLSGMISLANGANDRIVTASSSSALNGESNLTFNGTTLALTGNQTASGGGIFGNLSVGETAHSNTIQQRTGGNLHLNYNVSGNVLINEGGGYMQSRNHLPETTNNYELGSSTKRWKNLYMGQGGEVRFGDFTTSNFFGITEGLQNTYTDQDFLSLYYRNTLRFFSNNNNERVRFDASGNMTLYNGNIIGNSSNTMEIGSFANGMIKKIRMSQGGELHFGDTTSSNFLGITEGVANTFTDQDYISIYYRNSLKFFSNNNVQRLVIDSSGHFLPAVNNNIDLGSNSLRFRNIHTNDLNLSNEGNSNEVDGTWGQYTIQEGQDDLFLINRRSGKKYKFLLQEID